jgi:hypothetical protein
MNPIEITPAVQRDIDICQGFAASNYGLPQPDLKNAEAAKAAANRVMAFFFGPLNADGLPAKTLERDIASAILSRADAVRLAIAEKVVSGRTGPADYYEVLYNVLADSGSASSVTLPMDPALAAGITANLDAYRMAAADCGLCGACGACGACAACGVCGTCVASVVVTSVVATGTLGTLGVGGAAAWFFN